MSTLYFVDNPGNLPLGDDPHWLEQLAEQAGISDKLLLIGFADDDLVAIRRRLASVLAEATMLSVTRETQDRLDTLDPELCRLAIQGVVAGLAPADIEYHGHAGQILRDWLLTLAPPGRAVGVSGRRLRLAFVSPFPPEPTGIADYSAELLPYLAEHYEITLITSQPKVADTLLRCFPVIDLDAFPAHAPGFDRVLYQIGNSPYHAWQFDLLRHHPGVVVLHDVFLFDAVWWLQESRVWPDALRRQLFSDHGFPAVIALEDRPPRREAGSAREKYSRGPEQYPVNGFVTREAAGLIVHSAFARDLDRRWRADAFREPAAVIPHLRELPPVTDETDRAAARAELGIAEDVRLIASFGGISAKKLSDVLVEAFLEGPLATRKDLQLVLVGARPGGEFGSRLARQLRDHAGAARITITDYVDRRHYRLWLQATDIAVQLRQESRGESSGAIFDAMASGLALVANAHGSSAELPDEALVKLPDHVSAADLGDTLNQLVDDSARCRALGQVARHYVARHLDPSRVARAYANAIEGFAADSLRHRRDACLDSLAANSALRRADDEALMAASRALVELDTTSLTQPPRILFDVSTIAWHDLKTGIERVTRRLADQLLRHPPAGWRVELIHWGGDDFHLSRSFASAQLGIDPPAPDRPCEAREGDIYVSVEWAPPLLEQAGHFLKRMRARGVRCYFTVHDLLPLYLPDCFPEGTSTTMRRWFNGIAELADGITCVSAQVAGDVRHELQALPLEYRPWVRHFHLGADFSASSAAIHQLSEEEQKTLQAINGSLGATLLMVGTMEPRKGHRQVLDALERCWHRKMPLNLVIVGKQGWEVEDLATRLAHHPRRGHQLFWVEGASDALLEQLYSDSDCLVAASRGEGFGLPLIEAAHHGIPILARDIAVFREVAGGYAVYFVAETAEQLATELEDWYRRWVVGEIRGSDGMPSQTWSQSAEQWLAPILADQHRPLAVAQPQGEQA